MPRTIEEKDKAPKKIKKRYPPKKLIMI